MEKGMVDGRGKELFFLLLLFFLLGSRIALEGFVGVSGVVLGWIVIRKRDCGVVLGDSIIEGVGGEATRFSFFNSESMMIPTLKTINCRL